MSSTRVQQIERVWSAMSQLVFVPQTEQEYNQLVSLLDDLVDEVGEDKQHPLASLMDVVGVLVETYEDQHVPEITAL